MNKENSAPARLLPTDDENPAGPPGSITGSPYTWSHKFFGDYGKTVVFDAMESGELAVECEHVIVDNSNGGYASMQSHVIGAGASTAELVCKYSPTLSLGDMADFASVRLFPADAVVPRVSTPLLVPADSKVKKLLLKLYRRGGNGTITPEMWNAIVSATSGVPPTVPTGTGDDPLPEDATWGTILFDANANAASMKALYGDGDDVDNFIDQRAANNLVTAATLLLPKYRTGGIAGVLPCVEWDGANVPLSAPLNPTAATGAYTYYFVVENMDGGDGARLWGAGFGDSFQYSYYFFSDQIQAANNNLFGTPSLFVTDNWGMGDRHIYRFVKSPASSSHELFVDGVFKGSAAGAPQTNNTGAVDFMNYMSGLGISGRVGRGVAYNKNHNNASGAGSNASGLTAPEIILRGFWGTP